MSLSKLPSKINNFILSLVPENKLGDIEYIRKAVIKEKQQISEEFEAWKATLRDLRALPHKDFFVGKNLVRVFDVEKRIETDTDKAKLIVYNIHDKQLFNVFKRYRKDKIFITLKFISPRVLEQIVSVRRFYEKMLELCNVTLEHLSKIKEIKVENAENKNTNVR